MKKILSILFVFCSLISFGQATVRELRSGTFKMKPFSIKNSTSPTTLKEISLDTLLKATDNQITVAGLRALTGFTPFESYLITDSGKEGTFKIDRTDNTSTDNLGTVIVDASGRRWKRVMFDNSVNITWFGAKNILDAGNSNYNSTTAIINAIQSLRKNPKTILNTIGGENITAYSSGVIIVPQGVFRIDSISITQDLGLTIRGLGSRRTNNAIRAVSTLLIQGTNNKFGIKFENGGSRGGTIEDLDICYESSGFTGDIIDINGSVGITLSRVFLGTYGLNYADRLNSARSCLRTTYEEFLLVDNCVFDGAINGWWADDIRTKLSNTFGGSSTMFNKCTFYDFTGLMMRHDGNRTKENVLINSCAFNPINHNPVRCLDLNNINSLSLVDCIFTPSVDSHAEIEWIRLVNVTGRIASNTFSDFSKAGTLNGYLTVSNNVVYCIDGFTLTGGIIQSENNEFSKANYGYYISPTSTLSLKLGIDVFKNNVNYSYYVPNDSVLFLGIITYDNNQDNSQNGFYLTSHRIKIVGIGFQSVSSSSYSIPSKLTGKTISATGSIPQTFTLPVPAFSTNFTIYKVSNQSLTINTSPGTHFYQGNTTVSTSINCPADEIGNIIVLESYANVGWQVKSKTGNWLETGQLKNSTSELIINSNINSGEKLQVTGDAIIKTGSIEISDLSKGIILKSPNGTRWLIKINDSGVLTTTAL